MQGLADIRMYQFVYNFLNLGMETLSSFLLCNCDCGLKIFVGGSDTGISYFSDGVAFF